MLGDVAEIQVGIQTSADDVFLFLGPSEDDVPGCVTVKTDAGAKVKIEQAILRRCMKGSAEEQYCLLFPYDTRGELFSEAELATRYPQAWRYLLKNRARLEGRESGGFRDATWYRFGRKQGCGACVQPKVLVPSSLKKPKTVVDIDGQWAFTGSGKGGGGAWAVRPKADSDITCHELAEILEQPYAWDHFVAYGSPQKGGWRGVDRDVLASLPVLAIRDRW